MVEPQKSKKVKEASDLPIFRRAPCIPPISICPTPASSNWNCSNAYARNGLPGCFEVSKPTADWGLAILPPPRPPARGAGARPSPGVEAAPAAGGARILAGDDLGRSRLAPSVDRVPPSLLTSVGAGPYLARCRMSSPASIFSSCRSSEKSMAPLPSVSIWENSRFTAAGSMGMHSAASARVISCRLIWPSPCRRSTQPQQHTAAHGSTRQHTKRAGEQT